MSRLIFILLVVALVFWLLRRLKKSSSQQDKQDVAEQSEDMVRCARCGVHLPKSESILAGGNFYCCDAHRREHAAK